MFSFVLWEKAPVKQEVFANLALVIWTCLVFVSCDLNDTSNVDAQQPIISAQPESSTWNMAGTDSYSLTVTANVTDGGNITYQWYKNTNNANTDGTEMPGKTSAILTLQKEDYATDDDYYFYVIIINTNNSASGAKTATTTSVVAAVTVIEDPEALYVTAPIPENLIGHWKGFEDVHISETEFSSQMGIHGGYKGTIVKHRSNGLYAGYITIRVTENTNDPDMAGKYYVIHYKNLTLTTMSYSGAFSADDPDFEWPRGGGKATQAEAEAVYTVTAGYFGVHTDLVKIGGGDSFPNAIEGDWIGDGSYEIYITDTTIEVNMMGFMPVFIGEIVGADNNGETGYLVFKYTIVGSGMGPTSLVGTYSVLYWKGHADDTVSIAVGGTNPDFTLSNATSQTTPEVAVSVYITNGYGSLEFGNYELK